MLRCLAAWCLLGILTASAVAQQCVFSTQSCGALGPYGFLGPYGNYGGQGFTTNNQGYVRGGGSCRTVQPINYDLRNRFINQPVYGRMTENTDYFQGVDNMCITYFPIPDGGDTYISYTATVFVDGSVQIQTSISTEIGPGTLYRGTPTAVYLQRLFGNFGPNLLIGCTAVEYGEIDRPSSFALSYDLSPISVACVQQIQGAFNCANLGTRDGLYVLPYRLPTQCVTQQVCTVQNPLRQFRVVGPQPFFF